MYVTRPLSHLQKYPESLREKPEGPNSGFLVIQDEESERYSCFGCCKRHTLKDLPFPQNKELVVRYTSLVPGIDASTNIDISDNPVFLIPVLNQPLSSNRFYAIKPHGKHKGKAFTCSTEEGQYGCCFCRCVKDVKARPLDPRNIYQQIEVVPYSILRIKSGFSGVSVARDGFPPDFLRNKGWEIYTKTPRRFKLDTAQGLNSRLRARLPNFNDLSVSQKSSQPLVVGKWYCPFMFVKEGTLKKQMEKSMYYETTLEQRWEQIFTCQKNTSDKRKNSVAINVLVEKEEAFVGGSKASWRDKNVVDGVIWFTGEKRVGLGVEIVERMKWEQERAGWRGGNERQVKIDRVEEHKGGGKWSVFGCYVLVESFNLKRMDGSLVMSYEFKHVHHMKTKWE